MTLEAESKSSALSKLRDLMIVFAVIVYFVGFVYIFYYFRPFGVSIWSSAASPQDVLIFAYGVFSWNVTLTVFVIFGGVFVFFVINEFFRGMVLEISRSHWANTTRDLAVRALAIGLVIPFSCIFLAWWASLAAHDAVREKYLLVHLGSPERVRLVGSAEPKGRIWEHSIASINNAGSQGRVTIIAETSDRIVILVGGQPSASDDPYSVLPSDKIYNLVKANISVEISRT